MAFFILAPNQAARPFRRDQHDIEVGPRFDLFEMHGETVREQQRGTIRDAIDNRCIELFLNHIRGQKGNDGRTLNRFRRLLDDESVGLRLAPACSVGTQSNDDIKSAVFQIERVRSSLAAIAQDRYLLIPKTCGVDV